MKTHKNCTDCRKKKPISEYYERPNYNGSGTIYYKSQCKACEVLSTINWNTNNKEKYTRYQRNYWRKKFGKGLRYEKDLD